MPLATRQHYMRENNGDLLGPYFPREVSMLARRISSPKYGSAVVAVYRLLNSALGYPVSIQGEYRLETVYINGQKKASGQAAKQLLKYHLGVDA